WQNRVRAFAFDPLDADSRFPTEALEGVQAVYSLAGEPIGPGRWNQARKRRILESRVRGTRLLVQSLPSSVSVFLSASAVAFYPNSLEANYAETDPVS